MQRVARTVRLRPDAVEEYDRLHAAVWPEVLAAIERAGIRNYSIFRAGCLLFSYFELADGIEVLEVTERLLDAPECRRWEELVQSLQEPQDGAPGGAWWLPMKEVFHQA